MRHLIAALAVATTLAGCGGTSTEPAIAFSGNYTLRTVNGQTLPYVAVPGDPMLEALSGAFTVVDNGMNGGVFFSLITLRTTQGGQVSTQTDTDGGSYTRNGTAASFHHDDGSAETGTIDGSTLTFSQTSAGVRYAFVYRK